MILDQKRCRLKKADNRWTYRIAKLRVNLETESGYGDDTGYAAYDGIAGMMLNR